KRAMGGSRRTGGGRAKCARTPPTGSICFSRSSKPAGLQDRGNRKARAELRTAAASLDAQGPLSYRPVMDDAPVPLNIRAGGQGRFSVAVIGLGSIGGVAAGCLRAADRHDVVACVRQPLQRLTLERPEGTVEVELVSMMDPAEAVPVDWVLLCTKSQDTPSAAPWLARLCRPSTRVAVLQNGVDHVSRVSPLTAGATVVPAIVYYNGE